MVGDDGEEEKIASGAREFRSLTMARALTMIEVRGGAVW